MINVHVTDDWQGVAAGLADWSSLGEDVRVHFHGQAFADEDTAATVLADAEVIVPMRERTRFPASLIDRLPALRLLALTGKGTAHLDMEAITRRGIALAWSGAYSSAATAEMTLALMLAAARHIPEGDAAIRRGTFQADAPPGMVLSGKTLGIVGLGKIGTAVAGLGRALGMRIAAWSPNMTAARAEAIGAEADTLEGLMARSDVVSVHLRYVHGTPPIVQPAHIAAMKQGAILVNTARSGVIAMAAVEAAARAGRITAALDVFDQEPLAADASILTCPNTVLTPHLGFTTIEGLTAFYQESVENIAAWRAGRILRRLDLAEEGHA